MLKRPLNLVIRNLPILEIMHKSKVDGSRLMAWALTREVHWVFGRTSNNVSDVKSSRFLSIVI